MSEKKYVFQEFPKYIYHQSLPAKVVESIEAQNEAGPEWKEKPFAVSDDELESDDLVEDVLEEVKVKRKSKGVK